MMFESKFRRGAHVTIDGDGSIIGRVTAHTFRESYAICEVSYIHNGDAKCVWVEDWRLEHAP